MFNYRWPLFLFLLGALALGACQPVMPPAEAPVEESARTVHVNLDFTQPEWGVTRMAQFRRG